MSADVQARIEAALRRWEPLPEQAWRVPLIAAQLACIARVVPADQLLQRTRPVPVSGEPAGPVSPRLEEMQRTHRERYPDAQATLDATWTTSLAAKRKPRAGRRQLDLAQGVTRLLFKAYLDLTGQNPEKERGVVPVIAEVFEIMGIAANATSARAEVGKDWRQPPKPPTGGAGKLGRGM